MKSFETLIGTTTRATLLQDRQIKQVISRIVPARTLDHVEFCRLEGGRLRVTVDSAAWVARLRFSERQLVDELRRERLDIHTVSFHVSPSEVPVIRSTHREPNSPSPAAARALQALADSELDPSAKSSGTVDTANADNRNLQNQRTPRAGAAREKRHKLESHNSQRLRQELLKLAEKLRQP